jgi:hypothetical protein
LPYLGFLKEFYAQNSDFVLQAANTSFSLSIRQAIDNKRHVDARTCQMASGFINLRQFVQVSTGCSNSNQPDGIMEEKLYHLGNPEQN